MSATLNPAHPDRDFLEVPANYPFPSTSGKVAPLTLCSHWDPTRMLSYILPDQRVQMPLSFRPLTKVCTEYVTTAAPEPLPATGSTVFPSGSAFYPPDRYMQSIDNESLLRRQDRPLGISEKKQYIPNLQGDLFHSRVFLPSSSAPSSKMIDELSMPKVLLTTGAYHCRAEQDRFNMARAPQVFNNSTKASKYISTKKDHRNK
jgi:hypothetical protein